MNWLLLSIFSLITFTVYNLINKKIVDVDKISPFVYSGLIQLIAGLLPIPFILNQGVKYTVNAESLIFLLIVALIYLVGAYFYFTNLKHVELSITTIISSSSIFFNILLGYLLLGNAITLVNIVSGLLVLFAIIILFWKKDLKFKVTKNESLIILSSFCFAIGAIGDNYLQRFSDPISYLILTFLVTGGLILIVNYKVLIKDLITLKNNIKLLFTVIISSALLCISYIAVFQAYDMGANVSSNFIIIHAQVILISFLSIIFLGERDNLMKKIFAAIILMIAIFILGINTI